MRYYLGAPFQYNVSPGLKLENANKLFIKRRSIDTCSSTFIWHTFFHPKKDKRFIQNYLFIGYKLQHKNN